MCVYIYIKNSAESTFYCTKKQWIAKTKSMKYQTLNFRSAQHWSTEWQCHPVEENMVFHLIAPKVTAKSIHLRLLKYIYKYLFHCIQTDSCNTFCIVGTLTHGLRNEEAWFLNESLLQPALTIQITSHNAQLPPPWSWLIFWALTQ